MKTLPIKDEEARNVWMNHAVLTIGGGATLILKGDMLNVYAVKMQDIANGVDHSERIAMIIDLGGLGFGKSEAAESLIEEYLSIGDKEEAELILRAAFVCNIWTEFTPRVEWFNKQLGAE